VIYWLAINREAISFSDLKQDIICPALKRQLPDTLKSLRRKSLVEKSNALFTLQPVFMEWVTNQLIAKVCEEIETG
jgi:hypothetical protein